MNFSITTKPGDFYPIRRSACGRYRIIKADSTSRSRYAYALVADEVIRGSFDTLKIAVRAAERIEERRVATPAPVADLINAAERALGLISLVPEARTRFSGADGIASELRDAIDAMKSAEEVTR